MVSRRLGRSFCTDLGVAERREWLVTNGRGGYAMGTIAGTRTRSYHGLLVAALAPPVARRLVLASAQITIDTAGRTYRLATNAWGSGLHEPQGYASLDGFAVVAGVPTWTYALGKALVEVAIAMRYGRDETAVAIRALRGPAPLDVSVGVLASDRDHHGGGLPDLGAFATLVDGERATVLLPACGRTLHAYVPCGELSIRASEWQDFFLERERERGLPDRDVAMHVLDATFRVDPGESGGIVLGLAPPELGAPQVVAGAAARGRALAADAPTPLLAELAIAADAFVVEAAPGGAARTTIVAGYPWFSDWGRDTMIALPGLALAFRRAHVAAAVLRAYAPFVDGGMLPNRFPDDGAPPEYNSVDAALWYVETARACVDAHAIDDELVAELFPALRAIVDGYGAGTRYGIGVDPADGLLRAGEPGVQLTWMDAKVGDWVVTPRIGKPVEVNALWYAALRTVARFAAAGGIDPAPYERRAARVRESFGRFWNPERGCCYDVLDGPDGDDPAIRPNQLIAAAVVPDLLPPGRLRALVDVCARELLTPVGLRTLSPRDPGYLGRYGGDQRARDAAYHQGTVWPWLLGPFVRAHVNAYGDRVAARRFLGGLVDALDGDAIGTLGEIFEGDPPHAPCGTIAQAWSVAELVVALRLVE